ncbi:MAG TPA: phosphoenolpyruvate--protein phosphotransferase [Calditrichaeota bacterium]|nr:phosphoenolpyruvate--protein phosphotransferase [Calditrichota bacterium]
MTQLLNSHSNNVVVHGLPVSEGIGTGTVQVYYSHLDELPDYTLEAYTVPSELERYFSAINEVGLIFLHLQRRTARDLGVKQGEIYESYHLILEDPLFQEEIPEAIRVEMRNAESVIRRKLSAFEKQFLEVKNEYLRERIFDIRGVGRRLIFHLLRKDGQVVTESNEPNLIFAQELTPADSIHFHHHSLRGIVTEYGGKTSHAAILARSLEVPAIVGVKNILKKISAGDTAIVDGITGKIILRPDENVLREYRSLQRQHITKKNKLLSIVSSPIEKLSGREVRLYANLNDITEIGLAKKYGAEGVGLYRTELEFIARESFLSEEEQVSIYNRLVEAFPDKVVTIRVLDIGGDKFLPFAEGHPEANPFLGWRSIRILLHETEVFKTQLRAIFKASVNGRVELLIPMISSMEEVLATKAIIRSVKEELRKEKAVFNENIPLGIMVEIPSAAIMIDNIIQEVDFVSIGTNDLIQYTLAVDRNNEKVSEFYQPLNPAILELIKNVLRAGKKYNKPVTLCGEMAGEPLYTQLLLSLGIENFSMAPSALLIIKNILVQTTESDLKEIAERIKQPYSPQELAQFLGKKVEKFIKGVSYAT